MLFREHIFVVNKLCMANQDTREGWKTFARKNSRPQYIMGANV